MSEEVKSILAHIATWGASIVLRDGVPVLLDPNKALAPSDKAVLKLHRQEIINVLSEKSNTLFSESVPVKNDGLDVTGRKDRQPIKRKPVEQRPLVTDMRAHIVCARCGLSAYGGVTNVHRDGMFGVVEIGGLWYDLGCAKVIVLEKQLAEAKVGTFTEVPTVGTLFELWDELARNP